MSQRCWRGKRRRRIVDATLGACLLGTAACGADVGPQERETPRPTPSPYTAAECIREVTCDEVMVAAHRGHHLHVPENSLASIRAAAVLGAEVVEVDVRHTMDEQLVLMHDTKVDRTTDGNGAVSSMTAEAIRGLSLLGGQEADPESREVPSFTDALELAMTLGVMLYVDQKTDRGDLVRAAVVDAGALEHVLVRTDLASSVEHLAAEPRLIVMPNASDADELATALRAIPELLVVETKSAAIEVDLYSAARARRVKIQQDVFIADVAATTGDYSAWKRYVDEGLFLLQTNV
ncbi:MAG: glycerophosphodiester phosphodiesterase family protein, partial [Polyangiaceae bacterium]